MPAIKIPQARRIVVDTTGAQILQEESPETRDSRGIYLPRYVEGVSHIAIDIGGSLVKVVYFTRSPKPLPPTPPITEYTTSPFLHPTSNAHASSSRHIPTSPNPLCPPPLGALTPQSLSLPHLPPPPPSPLSSSRTKTKPPHPRRSSIPTPLPGGLLNFARFETTEITSLITFITSLITSSAATNRVSLSRMKTMVKIMATGGGAHMYYDRLVEELGPGVEVRREEEMECLILGLGFVSRVPEEVFWFSEELVYKVSHGEDRCGGEGEGRGEEGGEGGENYSREIDEEGGGAGNAGGIGGKINGNLRINGNGNGHGNGDHHSNDESQQPNNTTTNGNHTTHSPPRTIPPSELPRPSPTPPAYQVTFASTDDVETPHFPCLVVNIGSGVSIVKVDEDGGFERVSGTSLGGGTLWGLLSLLTDAETFDEMLSLSEKGDNARVDMLVGDIYGSDYSKIGLKSSTIASTFGKVFRKGVDKKSFRQEDIAKSLLYAISNNIGHVAYMNAAKYGLDRVYFGGCFIRGHAATISTLSYAIRFWSKGTMRACFLRHEGFLGAIGAWIKNVEPNMADTETDGDIAVSAGDRIDELNQEDGRASELDSNLLSLSIK